MILSRFAHFLVPLFIVLGAGTAASTESTLGMNESPIHDAARTGTRADVERLLKADPALRDARTYMGSTPLHYAALNLDPGPLVTLLAAGANVNARDKEGNTPLHLAAFSTRLEQTKLLLAAGADVYARNELGRDPLSLARKVRADEVAGVISLWVLKGCKPSVAC
ncbi:ankyrin repeat domain-containing protein [Sulfurisoma sediminicola]|uniref:Ankyrin repeat protein n=1 Tax=Sulfurisoma sediminicola TaxID=1381557 RepID=A0A497X930_9PROT|nr:ankyrin repeat domain-containing protein [Sulfurisoma sediminicola]RLJ62751.1 ankyrin repeat protein [Sulfurisoma sediminicola]